MTGYLNYMKLGKLFNYESIKTTFPEKSLVIYRIFLFNFLSVSQKYSLV